MRAPSLTPTIVAPGRARPDGVADGPRPAGDVCPGSITLPTRNAATTTSNATAAGSRARLVRRRHSAAAPLRWAGPSTVVRCRVGGSVTASGPPAGYRMVGPATVTAGPSAPSLARALGP